MRVRSPPLQMGQQLCRQLRRSPGTARQRCYAMTNGQMHALTNSRVQPPSKASSLQRDPESLLCSQAHHAPDPHQLAPLVTFLRLTVDQTRRYRPSKGFAPTSHHFSPLTKVSREPQRRRD
jgi:hypothetical protein